ncbi:MAG TPA: pyridoxamine 5'-phosphate oxidase family protein [Candidatus Baltobacteraceae bacterium]
MPNYSRPSAPDIDAFLSRPLFAHLATASPDGPRESPVWFLWEHGAVWIIANAYDSFPKRIGVEPRCALGIVDFDMRTGRVEHVGMRGKAGVEAWESPRARRLLARYLGENQDAWDTRFLQTVENYSNRWVRFVPETAVVRNQSYATS